MRRRYTTGFKRRVIAFVDAGNSLAEAAREFDVPRTTVAVWMTRGDNRAHTDLRQEFLQMCWDEHITSLSIPVRFGGITRWAIHSELASWRVTECQRTGKTKKLLLLTQTGLDLLESWKKEN